MMPPSKKKMMVEGNLKKTSWMHSTAHKILFSDIRSGAIPNDMSWEEGSLWAVLWFCHGWRDCLRCLPSFQISPCRSLETCGQQKHESFTRTHHAATRSSSTSCTRFQSPQRALLGRIRGTEFPQERCSREETRRNFSRRLLPNATRVQTILSINDCWPRQAGSEAAKISNTVSRPLL